VGSGRSPDDPERRDGGPSPGEPLSDTERRILELLCEPYTRTNPERVPASNKSIADELYISVETVRTHLRSLYGHFGMGGDTGLSPSQKRNRLAEIALTRDLTIGDAAAVSATAPADPGPVPPDTVAAAGSAPPVPRDRRGRRRIAMAVAAAAAAIVGVIAIALSAGGDPSSRGTHAGPTVGTPATVAANVLVLLDVSATMQRPLDSSQPLGDTRMETAREFVAAGVENARDHDRLGVWLFGDSSMRLLTECRGGSQPCELQPLAAATKSVRTRLRSRLLRLHGNGDDTPPYAVIGRAVQALRVLAPPRNTVSSVVIITDGGAEADLSRVSALAAAAGRDDRIQVFVAAAGRQLCDGVLERVIGARFPGACYEVRSVAEAETALRAILPGLRTRPRAQPSRTAGAAPASTATTPVRRAQTGGARRPLPTRSSGACPAGEIRVPNVIGKNHQLAQDTMQAAGLILLTERDATGRGRRLIFDRDWRTVRQSPAAGSCVSADTIVVLFARMIDE
jgi:DNA-binding CsgD family transcriptional regulator